jgi:hypothetical protein
MDFKVTFKPPVEPEVETATITLNKTEALYLQAILGSISGWDGEGGMR